MELRISEQFYSIQGEGRTMGVPAVFVRLQACNILCKGEWTCDTIEVWKTGKKTSIGDWIFQMNEYAHHLKNGAHLIFTGGEPILQQLGIITAIKAFGIAYGFKPFVEIETNGTITPLNELSKLVDLFNCSFKLENSGVKYERRIKINSLKKINNQNSIFKIVVKDMSDYNEAKKIFDEVGIEKKNIYLMPPADSIGELSRRSQQVAAICIAESVNFSTRMQIILWNKTTGV
jgi:organic radical activating enzyme